MPISNHSQIDTLGQKQTLEYTIRMFQNMHQLLACGERKPVKFQLSLQGIETSAQREVKFMYNFRNKTIPMLHKQWSLKLWGNTPQKKKGSGEMVIFSCSLCY